VLSGIEESLRRKPKMATLTEQMRDLAADILNGHEERRAWLGALREEVGSMQEENRAELGTLRREVRDMLEESEAAREETTAAARKERKTWLGGLKKEVKGMRKEFRSDQQGARQAWREMMGRVGARQKGQMPAGAQAHAARPRARSRAASRRSK
jgi:hypothetical protein